MARNSAQPRGVSDDPQNAAKLVPRDASGRLLPGAQLNPGGRPANPMKPLILKMLSSPDGEKIMAAMAEKALEGDVNAFRALMDYSVGKPAMAEEDREAAGKGADTLAVLLALVRSS